MKNYKIQTVQQHQEQKQQRNQTILQMRQDGHTLQSIANKFGCSREWIRLILKNDLNTTAKFKFNPQQHCKADEYSALDITELTGYSFHYIYQLIKKNWIPNSTRFVKTRFYRTPDAHFWKKTDIDRWIDIKLKYLKISLDRFLNSRLNGYDVYHPSNGRTYRAAYNFYHPDIQKRYKLLLELQSGNSKGKLSYNSKHNDLVMKEFNDLIKPTQYVPSDYSKFINKITTKDFANKGLYNHMTTAKILDISGTTIKRYRLSGFLKEGVHYFAGDHYFHRYMYDPEKTKKAMIKAGYDVEFAQSLKDAKRGKK